MHLPHNALALVLQPTRVEALRLLVRLPKEVLGFKIFASARELHAVAAGRSTVPSLQAQSKQDNTWPPHAP